MIHMGFLLLAGEWDHRGGAGSPHFIRWGRGADARVPLGGSPVVAFWEGLGCGRWRSLRRGPKKVL
jgi:hypothetical protein